MNAGGVLSTYRYTKNNNNKNKKIIKNKTKVKQDAIFFGLGNLGLKIVAMSYEISLCFGSTQSENQLRTYGGQTARANMRSPIIRNIGRFFGRPDRAIQRTGY